MGIRSCASLEEAVRACFGEDIRITGRSFVGGGDINDSFCLSLSSGERVFVKSNSSDKTGFFDAEEQGLNAIASAGVIKTPTLLCKGTDRKQGRSFLMMEMIESSGRIKDFWEVFGRELAMLHLADTADYVPDGVYGFYADNYIGAGVQKNSPRNSWVDFFRECRLEPQIKRAEGYFEKSTLRELIHLVEKLDSLMPEPAKPSLLHGDLWAGNYIVGEDGKAWLIDPAVYVGHAEADLAMTELFGRFHDAFYRAYESVFPLQDGYRDRKDLYNLYHLLNHLNLFGRSYLSAVLGIVRRYG
ncbi:MAG: fructosamine kinase family protein [Lachnospiraceae bacterium]|nr:fructosamine kinase family protein [Lachnospiraceae bacterium]